MLTRFIKNTSFNLIKKNTAGFSIGAGVIKVTSVYPDIQSDSNSYYKLLGLQPSATFEQINKAYAQLGKIKTPDSDPSAFKQINEAFIILSNNKSREAYDSLLKSRKISYISDPQISVRAPIKKSYIADRKQQASKSYKKLLNLDQFGRYKGGVPKPRTNARGGALEQPGIMPDSLNISQEHDLHPEYSRVDSQTKRSFQEFHQDQREYRKTRWTWYTMQVDYNFFTMKSLRKYWFPLKIFATIFLILPIFQRAYYLYQVQKKSQCRNQKQKKMIKDEGLKD